MTIDTITRLSAIYIVISKFTNYAREAFPILLVKMHTLKIFGHAE
jgi:hypothetical protein